MHISKSFCASSQCHYSQNQNDTYLFNVWTYSGCQPDIKTNTGTMQRLQQMVLDRSLGGCANMKLHFFVNQFRIILEVSPWPVDGSNFMVAGGESQRQRSSSHDMEGWWWGVSFEQRKRAMVSWIVREILPSCKRVNLFHFGNPSRPTIIMECQKGFLLLTSRQC